MAGDAMFLLTETSSGWLGVLISDTGVYVLGMSDRVRWQYRAVNLGSFFAGKRLAEVLGQLGSEGWELVAVYDKASNWWNGFEKGFVLFKREVPSGEEPDGPWAQFEAADVASKTENVSPASAWKRGFGPA